MKLTIKNLGVRRGMRQVLSHINFDLAGGDGLLLTGHNGSGKTTLLRALAGFIPVNTGTIHFSPDSKTSGEELVFGEYVHYVGHLNGIKTTLNVEENLQFWKSFLENSEAGQTNTQPQKKLVNGSLIDNALEVFDLVPLKHIPAGFLSAGQKRRLCLARLELVYRSVLILDEPTVSLDTHSVEILAKHVTRHIENGGIVIAATHIPLGVKFNRSLQLEAGQIIEADGKTVKPVETGPSDIEFQEFE